MVKFKLILPVFIFMLSISCNNPIENPTRSNVWMKINDLNNLNVRDVKIYNNEIYVGGIEPDGSGSIYKSSDGFNWLHIESKLNEKSKYHITTFDFYKGDIIVSASLKPLFRLTKDSVYQCSDTLRAYTNEMVIMGDKIIVGCENNYGLSVVQNGKYNYVLDSTNAVGGNCCKVNYIVQIDISKLLPYNGGLLIGNLLATKFVSYFNNSSIECFPTEGINNYDRHWGCHDLVLIDNEIYAGTFARVMKFNGSDWKMLGDSLPYAPQHIRPYATALTGNPSTDELYVGTNYIGVLKYDKDGWVKINDGLETDSKGFYDSISKMICFKNNLLIFYGGGKVWTSKQNGARIFTFK